MHTAAGLGGEGEAGLGWLGWAEGARLGDVAAKSALSGEPFQSRLPPDRDIRHLS
jgi:hypothetical protein